MPEYHLHYIDGSDFKRIQKSRVRGRKPARLVFPYYGCGPTDRHEAASVSVSACDVRIRWP